METKPETNGDEKKGFPHRPRRPEVRWAVDAFKTKRPGDEITLDELRAAVHLDCDGGSNSPGRKIFYRARKELAKDPYWLVIEWDKVRKVYRVLESSEIVDSFAPALLGSMRRKNRRLSLAISGIDPESLDQAQQTQHQAHQLVNMMIGQSTSPCMRKKLTAKIDQRASLGVPDAGKLLELMQSRKP